MSLALLANLQASAPDGANRALELHLRALELFDALDPTQPMVAVVQPEMQKIRDMVEYFQAAVVNAPLARPDHQGLQPGQHRRIWAWRQLWTSVRRSRQAMREG